MPRESAAARKAREAAEQQTQPKLEPNDPPDTREPEPTAVETQPDGTKIYYAPPELVHIRRELRRPFSPAAVKWKVQGNPKSMTGNATVIGYIDARLVQARFNAVCPGQWKHTYLAPPMLPSGQGPGGVLCRIAIGDTIHEDVGTFDGSDEKGVKGGYSDALKRAAVHFGVGESIYATPRFYLGPADGVNISEHQEGQKTVYRAKLTAKAEGIMRQRYQHWLDTFAIKEYGPVLSHGEYEDEAGDAEAGDADHRDQHEHGAPMGDAMGEALPRALQYLQGFSGVDGAAILAKLTERYGYMPEPAARALATYAAAVKAAEPSAPAEGQPEGQEEPRG